MSDAEPTERERLERLEREIGALRRALGPPEQEPRPTRRAVFGPVNWKIPRGKEVPLELPEIEKLTKVQLFGNFSMVVFLLVVGLIVIVLRGDVPPEGVAFLAVFVEFVILGGTQIQVVRYLKRLSARLESPASPHAERPAEPVAT